MTNGPRAWGRGSPHRSRCSRSQRTLRRIHQRWLGASRRPRAHRPRWSRRSAEGGPAPARGAPEAFRAPRNHRPWCAGGLPGAPCSPRAVPRGPSGRVAATGTGGGRGFQALLATAGGGRGTFRALLATAGGAPGAFRARRPHRGRCPGGLLGAPRSPSPVPRGLPRACLARKTGVRVAYSVTCTWNHSQSTPCRSSRST